MKFVDPAPPLSPSLDEQADALQKGLGRARQWAMAGKLEFAPLLEACLHDQRYDQQVENCRGEWLWQLVQAAHFEEQLRGPLLEQLQGPPDERSANQHCELAYYYAAAGDERFRTRLYEIVEWRLVPDFPGLGEYEILKLDGADAFVFIARIRGKTLETQEWDWTDDDFMSHATERLGEDRVSELLASSTDKEIRRFKDSWLAHKSLNDEPSPSQDWREKMQAIAVDDVIAQAESDQTGISLYRGWGMCACDEDLKTVFEALCRARDPLVMIKFLCIFSNRALPIFDARLIDLCEHEDESVRRWASSALHLNTHPLVREYAMRNLRQGSQDEYSIRLLVNNYSPGDECVILDALELSDDNEDYHYLLMYALQVLEKNEGADPSKLALVIYRHTPCAHCRFDAAQLLESEEETPDWLPIESRLDSYERCRNLFRDPPAEALDELP